jgi:TonB-linked SusC/RagA family outer membrane protein
MKKRERLRHLVIALCSVSFLLLLGHAGSSQPTNRTVTGTINAPDSIPLSGATITVKETGLSTRTNDHGQFIITVPAGQATLEVTYVGYSPGRIIVSPTTTNVILVMQPPNNNLNEVIVIGYGATRKKDLTGAVTSITEKDFNPGIMGSPEQLINGKAAGVQIMSNNGSPGSGNTVRIRGGASLSASNDPLIVVDGVPLEAGGISGNGNNFLALLNPNDIESINILKDASATAIYGSRASNGVMIITTKKGATGPLKVTFNSLISVQTVTRLPDMLSPEQFRNLIETKGSDAQKALLGNTSTNWTDQVFEHAIGNDNNISVSGSIAKKLPFRASLGYLYQDGLLKTDNLKRLSGSLVLSPSFFDRHLKVDINLKGSVNDNSFANQDAVWAASAFDPTQPVFSGKEGFGGYYERIDNAGVPVVRALRNPLGLLQQEQHKSTVRRSIGTAEVDYKFHFLPDLRAHAILGYDIAEGEGTNFVPDYAAAQFTRGGIQNSYSQKKTNKLFTAYLNYTKNLPGLKSRVDLTAGYDYQNWLASNPAFIDYNVKGEVQATTPADSQRHVLLSYYGRLNYTFNNKYLLTATIRRDGTSRFNEDNRWGVFPSLALAWKIKEENFLVNSDLISDLKLRVGFGVTGQQEGIGNYSYLPNYTIGTEFARYRFGNTYYQTYRPQAYVSDLKWESTEAWNAGIDFGLFSNKLTGTLDYYYRKTKDLLAYVSVPAGSNLTNNITTNVGNITSKGLELSLNTTLISTSKLSWTVGANATWQDVKITNLTLVPDTTSPGSFTGPEVGSRGLQIFSPGYAPYMFYVYKQVYDNNGKPIEGMYTDINKDGIVNEKDFYRYHSPMPEFMLGFNTQVSYGKWSASTVLRASFGNYVYNNVKANQGSWETLQYNPYELINLSSDYLNTGFTARQFFSDYFVENASFLKMDNISIGYDFGNVWKKTARLRVGALVQNVFTITKYDGVDPEISNGFDNSFYPRPRTFSLNVNLSF